MRALTFQGFLKNYLRQLSGVGTESANKLLEMARINPRLKAPLVLYAKASLPKNRLGGLQNKNAWLAEQIDLYFSDAENEKELLQTLKENRVPDEYKKVHQSYLAKRDKIKQEQELKDLIRAKVKRLAEEKKISDYRVYKDLGINSGNYHAFVHQGDVSKLGLDRARQMLEYLEAK